MRLFMSISILLSTSICFASPPTIEEMTSWLNKYPNEVIKYHSDDPKASFSSGGWDVLPKNIKFDFSGFRKIKEIFLTNKERAYLVPIVLDNRGRNGMNQTALVIPEQQQVIPLLDNLVKEVDDIQDLNSDNVSEIIVHAISSGGGSESGKKAIIHLDENGTIYILHEVTVESNKGMFGDTSTHYSEQNVEWEFIDRDDKSSKLLKESITISKGRDKKSPNVTTTVKFYQLTNNGFELQKKEKNNLVK